MASDPNIQINVEGDALIAIKELQQNFILLDKQVNVLEEGTKKAFKGIKNTFSSIDVVSFTQSIENLAGKLNDLAAPGMAFESSLADLSAITGIAGEKLSELGDKARANAKTFGGDAAASVETYKLLLSQLGPELAQTPAVLGEMADSVSVLSKTMGGDTTGAVEVLTTAMNQYGVSIDDPLQAQAELNRMMNVMSAGAKQGSAELPALKAAIQNVGGDAKSAGLSFEEMVSAIEALDKAGRKGAEGGVALRNMLASLNQGRFLPKDVQQELQAAGIDLAKLSDKSLSFTDRLRALNPIAGDAALLSKLFGKENKLAAEALLNNISAQEKMTQQITGTNTAFEQANIIMDTQAEKMGRVHAWLNDLKIMMSPVTSAVLPFAEIGVKSFQAFSTLAPGIQLLTNAVNGLRVAENRLLVTQKLRAAWTKVATTTQRLFNLETYKSIGLAIRQNALALKDITLKALQAAWTKVATTTQWLFNIETYKSIGIAIRRNALMLKDIAIKALQATWTGIVTAAQWLWNVAMTANPVGIIIVGIGALIGALAWLTDGFSGFGDFFMGFWEKLKKWFWALVDFWAEYLNPFSWLITLIDLVFPGAKAAIFGFFSDVWDNIYNTLIAPLTKAWDWVKGLFDFGDDADIDVEVKRQFEEGEQPELAPLTKDWDWVKGLFDFGDDADTDVEVKRQFEEGEQPDLAPQAQAVNYEVTHRDEYVTAPQNHRYTGLGLPFVGAPKDEKKESAAPNKPTPRHAAGVTTSGGIKSGSAGFASAEKKEINTRIESLVKNLNIHVPELSMAKGKIKQMVEEALVGSVRDAEAAI